MIYTAGRLPPIELLQLNRKREDKSIPKTTDIVQYILYVTLVFYYIESGHKKSVISSL